MLILYIYVLYKINLYKYINVNKVFSLIFSSLEHDYDHKYN